MIANELVTKFKFDVGNGFKRFDNKLKEAVKKTNRATDKMKDSLKGVGKGFKGAFNARLKLAGVKRAKKGLSEVQQMARSLKTTVIGMGAGYLGFQAVNDVMSRTLKVGSEVEQLMTGLTTLRGPQQARRDMKDLQVMSAKTPYKVNELTDSFMRLNAAGFKVDIKAMQKLGDLAAGTTGKSISDLTETMLSAARGQGSMVDNFNGMAARAKNGGLEISSLDSKTGKLTKTMIKAGDKAGLLDFYLKAATEQDTAGAMERLSKTAKGLASTLSDNIDLALLAFYNSMSGSLKDLSKWLIDVAQKAQPMARDFGVFVKLNLPGFIDKTKTAFKMLGTALTVAGVAWVTYKGYMLSAMALDAALWIFNAARAFIAMDRALKLATVSQWLFNAAVGFIPALIMGAVAAVAALAYDFYTFFQTGDSYLLRFTEGWPLLHNAILNVYNMIVSIGMGLMDLGGVFSFWQSIALGAWAAVAQGASDSMAAIGIYISAFVQTGIAYFNQFLLGVQSAFSGIMSAAAETGSSISSAIMGALNSIGTWLAGLPGKAIAAFNGLVSAARNAAANMPVIGTAMKMAGFNRGGYVPGAGNTDTVPAILTPGEFVIPKGTVQKILAGRPEGMAALSQQMRAPQLASVGTNEMMSSSVGTYSVPSSSMGAPVYNVTINAPVTQTNHINGASGTPSDIGNRIGQRALNTFNRGLSDAARQVPQRIART